MRKYIGVDQIEKRAKRDQKLNTLAMGVMVIAFVMALVTGIGKWWVG